MNRAERSRLEKKGPQKPKTYTFTHEQLQKAINDGIREKMEQVKQEAINTAMLLLLTLPLEVLIDHYWKKTYAKRIPEFTEKVLEYYSRWQDGELDMEKLKADLWEYGGVRLEERED